MTTVWERFPSNNISIAPWDVSPTATQPEQEEQTMMIDSWWLSEPEDIIRHIKQIADDLKQLRVSYDIATKIEGGEPPPLLPDSMRIKSPHDYAKTIQNRAKSLANLVAILWAKGGNLDHPDMQFARNVMNTVFDFDIFTDEE